METKKGGEGGGKRYPKADGDKKRRREKGKEVSKGRWRQKKEE
ncbi:hypothetical protein P4U44_05335 [Alkalihalobacillus alcalophilus]|nr:hypothetical protein [Alkalihalobacillus alcalophilus]MED1561332.1 hypothetical protein [Alkalihalobacillus alcalophilus]